MESVDDCRALGERSTAIIGPLAVQNPCSRASRKIAAEALNLSECHIRRLIKKYQLSGGSVTSLITVISAEENYVYRPNKKLWLKKGS
jgi:hypothetical protein